MPTKHQVLVLRKGLHHNESTSANSLDIESSSKTTKVVGATREKRKPQDESTTTNKKYILPWIKDKNEAIDNIERKMKQPNDFPNKKGEKSTRRKQKSLSSLNSNDTKLDIDRNKDDIVVSARRMTRSQSRALTLKTIENGLQKPANERKQRKTEQPEKWKIQRRPKSKSSARYRERKNLQVVRSTKRIPVRKQTSNVGTKMKKNNVGEKYQEISSTIPKHALIPDRVPSPIMSSDLEKKDVSTKDSGMERLNEDTDNSNKQKTPECNRAIEKSPNQFNDVIDNKCLPSDHVELKDKEFPLHSNLNQNWLVPNELTLKMIEDEKKMLTEYLESKKVMNQRFLEITPKPSKDVPVNYPQIQSNVQRKGKVRGSYKCGMCGAMKKDHVCQEMYVVDKSTQTEQNVILTDKVICVSYKTKKTKKDTTGNKEGISNKSFI